MKLIGRDEAQRAAEAERAALVEAARRRFEHALRCDCPTEAGGVDELAHSTPWIRVERHNRCGGITQIQARCERYCDSDWGLHRYCRKCRLKLCNECFAPIDESRDSCESCSPRSSLGEALAGQALLPDGAPGGRQSQIPGKRASRIRREGARLKATFTSTAGAGRQATAFVDCGVSPAAGSALLDTWVHGGEAAARACLNYVLQMEYSPRAHGDNHHNWAELEFLSAAIVYLVD